MIRGLRRALPPGLPAFRLRGLARRLGPSAKADGPPASEAE